MEKNKPELCFSDYFNLCLIQLYFQIHQILFFKTDPSLQYTILN